MFEINDDDDANVLYDIKIKLRKKLLNTRIFVLPLIPCSLTRYPLILVGFSISA